MARARHVASSSASLSRPLLRRVETGAATLARRDSTLVLGEARAAAGRFKFSLRRMPGREARATTLERLAAAGRPSVFNSRVIAAGFYRVQAPVPPARAAPIPGSAGHRQF